jgi:predicted enzyme related to lactoylglutathione lyase
VQAINLKYVTKFVADMPKAVKFYRDAGLLIRYQSADWIEFATGDTILALHPADSRHPAGRIELGFTVADVQKFYSEMTARGVPFSMPPQKQDFGILAQFIDADGTPCSVGCQFP